MPLLHIQSECSKTLRAKTSYSLYRPVPIHNFFALLLVTIKTNAKNVSAKNEIMFYKASLKRGFEINDRIQFEFMCPNSLS
jgi:hypothetical protein